MCGCSSHGNIPPSSPADGKINTHSYENVPLRSPAVGKINIGSPQTHTPIYHNFDSNAVLPMGYEGLPRRTAWILMRLTPTRCRTFLTDNLDLILQPLQTETLLWSPLSSPPSPLHGFDLQGCVTPLLTFPACYPFPHRFLLQ